MNRSLPLICVALLAGCAAKPVPEMPTLADVSLAEDAVSLAIAEAVGGEASPETSKGILGRMFGARTPPAPVAVVAEGAEDITTPIDLVDVASDVPSVEVAAPAPQGMFGRLFGGTRRATPVVSAGAATPEITPDVLAPARAGFLSNVFAPKVTAARTGPDAQDVPVGTQLPFGQIARNCDVSGRELGTKVDANAGYTLYDTIPNATAQRTHYITGFKDKCARQFTAATSLMGDIGTHEVVRYLPSNAKLAYSETDNAYETVKASFCRASRGQPCGAKLDRFAKTTTFITAYERFGSSPSWSNILLHDGQVIAIGSASR
ncbi:MAG: hypothetical protein KC439_02520 [Yoonia sp.]|nr:hypothetical protein [Yoonia sp.]